MPEETSEQISKRNDATLKFFVPQWLQNARENAPVVARGMRNGQAAYKVPFNGKDPNKGIVIVASGMSLYHQREQLKELNKYVVICSPTNYGLCKAFGLHPDVIAVADSNPTQAHELFKIIHHSPTTNIVASPTMTPLLNQIWPWNKLYWFKGYVQNKDGNFNTPYNFFLDHLFKDVTDHIMQAGSVTNMCLILVELFRKMGRFGENKEHPPVFLVGSDMCVSKDNYHRAFKYHETQTNFVQEPLYGADKYPIVLVRHEGKVTSTQMYNYRRSLLMLWQQVKWKLYNCSEWSLLEGYVPYMSIDEVVEDDNPHLYRKYDDSFRKKCMKKLHESANPTLLDGREYDIMNLTLAQPVTATEVAGSNIEVTK